MSGQINGIVKKDRAKQLIQLSNELGYKYNQQYVNKDVEVLIEEKVKDYYVGHTTNFIKVLINTTKEIEKNSIMKVKVIKADIDHVLAMEDSYETK